MPFPFWPFRRDKNSIPPVPKRPVNKTPHREQRNTAYKSKKDETRQTDPKPAQGLTEVKRHFYNEKGFQCYASFFRHWGGWVTAGHCLTDAQDLLPPFANGEVISWPGGLDAALIGARLPPNAPPVPKIGQRIIAYGFPAGSRHLEARKGHVYICLLYTSPSPRDRQKSRMPSSA